MLTDQPWVLKGNLAFIREGKVNTIDTRGLTSSGTAVAVATAVPEMVVATATATSTPLPPSPTPVVLAPEQSSEETGRPAWLIPLVGVTGLAVIAIFAIAFWQARRQTSTRM